MHHFWQRWLKERLPTLSVRKRWFSTERDLEPKDVEIVQPHTPRGRWLLGHVVRVYKGHGGHVRAAHIVLNGKEITRPISTLCHLKIQD